MGLSCGQGDARPEGSSGCGVAPEREAQLAREGWQRRTTLSGPGLDQAVEGYQALGFEVHLEPFDLRARGDGECVACYEAAGAAGKFSTVFTRKPDKNG